MTNLTVNEVIASFVNFTEDELHMINKNLIEIVKAKRKAPNSVAAIKVANARAALNVGDQVKWISSKIAGAEMSGKIIKIKPKYILVETGAGNWNVHPNLLSKV